MDAALLTGIFAVLGLAIGHWLGRSKAHADRLRSLYADVLHAAIRLTPLSLQYRVGPEDMRPSDDELNMLRARLSVESEEDESAILRALSGVMIFSGIYRGEYEHHKADPSAVPTHELGKTEAILRQNMDDLQRAIRERVATAERPSLRLARLGRGAPRKGSPARTAVPADDGLVEHRDAERTGTSIVGLRDFVEVNRSLLTTMGIFVALAVFANGLPIRVIGAAISFFFVFGTVLLAIELWSRFPDEPTGLLSYFRWTVWSALTFLVFYFLLDYRTVWRFFLIVPLFGLILWLIVATLQRVGLGRYAPGGGKSTRGSGHALGENVGRALVWGIAFISAALLASPLNDLLDELRKQAERSAFM